MMKRILKSLKCFDYYCIVVIIVTRLVLLIWVYPDKDKMLDGDSPHYEGLAISLIQEGRYYYAPDEPYSDMIRPPGYPLFIAVNYLIFGLQNYVVVAFWNILGILIIYLGIKKLIVIMNVTPQKWTFIILSLDFAWLLYSKDLITEPIFTALLVWDIIWLVKGVHNNSFKYLFLSSVALGICTLIKPITLYLPIFVLLFLLFKLRNLSKLISYGVLFMMTISPWLIRNKIVHNSFSFTSIQNNNLLYAHAAFVYADLYSITHREGQDKLDRILQDRLVGEDRTSYTHLNSVTGIVAREVLLLHPLLYAKAIVRGMFITLFDPGRMVFNRTFPFEDTKSIGLTNIIAKKGIWGTLKFLLHKQLGLVIPLLIYLLFLILVNSIALLGLVCFWKRSKFHFVLITMIFLYLLILGGPNGYARFRLYIFPFLLLYVNFGVEFLANLLKDQAKSRVE